MTNMSDDNKPDTQNLDQVLEAADRADSQIAAWPSWKRELAEGQAEEECTCGSCLRCENQDLRQQLDAAIQNRDRVVAAYRQRKEELERTYGPVSYDGCWLVEVTVSDTNGTAWRRRLRVDEHVMRGPHSSAVTRQIQDLAVEALSDVITGRGNF